MAVAKFLLCLVLVVASVGVIQGKGGHGHGHSHSHSHHSSHGHGSHGSSHSSHSSQHSSGSHGSSKSSSSSSHTSHSGSGGSHSSSGHAQGQGSASRYWSSRRETIPTYYTRPQYVYVTQYRNSENRRYSDILHGLTMYNLGRSHSHHDHYFRDNYYDISRDRVTDRPYGNGIDDTVAVDESDIANCYLKLIRNGQQEKLQIPCVIVSTFTDGNRTLQDMPQRVNCTAPEDERYRKTVDQYNYMQRYSLLGDNFTNNDVAPCRNKTIDNPLRETGPKVDVSNVKCEVEIQTSNVKITNDVDCEVLLKYAKMPVPAEAPTNIMPERKKLKAMLDHPPWWLSLFVAA